MALPFYDKTRTQGNRIHIPTKSPPKLFNFCSYVKPKARNNLGTKQDFIVSKEHFTRNHDLNCLSAHLTPYNMRILGRLLMHSFGSSNVELKYLDPCHSGGRQRLRYWPQLSTWGTDSQIKQKKPSKDTNKTCLRSLLPTQIPDNQSKK